MLRKFRIRASLIAGLAAMLAITGCASSGDQENVSEDNILKIGWRAAPGSFDPQKGVAGIEMPILYTMYDTLIALDQDTMQPLPGIAESWDQSDPSVLTLQLREGVTFHDGTPVDAEAVKYTLERAASEGSIIAPDVANIESVDVLSPLEVRLNLSRPDTSLVLTLADRAGMVLPPSVGDSEDFARNPVGAGPFEFESYRTGDVLHLGAYEGYWDKENQHLDGIDFTIITDSSSAVNAVRTGQQDIIAYAPFQDVIALADDDSVNVQTTPSLASNVLWLNTAFAPFDDVRVREALAISIDRTAFVESALFGLGEETWTSFSSASWALATDIVPTYSHNAERAKALLAEAGHPDGVAFKIAIYSDPMQVRMAEVLKEQVSSSGFDMTIDVHEITQQTQLFLVEKTYPMGLSAGTMRPDPSRVLRTAFDSTSFFNAGDREVPGMMEALDLADSTSDLEERKAHLADAQAAVAEFVPFVPIASQNAVTISQPRVKDFIPSLQDKPNFNRVRLEG